MENQYFAKIDVQLIRARYGIYLTMWQVIG